MTRLPDIALRVLATSAGATQDDYKRVAEVCIATHYAQRFYPGEYLNQSALDALQDRLMSFLHRDAFLRMPLNPFLVLQNVTPYVFLRAQGLRSDYYEALLDVFRNFDTAVREGYHYRALERDFLLFKLDEAPRPRAWDTPIFDDARQVHAFNRDMGYALTHTVMYSTDFGGVTDRVDHVHDALMCLAADALARNDVDLCLECLLCLTSQAPDPDVLADMTEIISWLQRRNAVMLEAMDIRLDYHPMLVHDMLRARMLALTGRDIVYDTEKGTPDGPIRALGPLWTALGGKNVDAIEQAYGDWTTRFGARAFLSELVAGRLVYLRALAGRNALFEREFSHLAQRDDALYPQYLGKLSALADRFPSLGADMAGAEAFWRAAR